MSNSCVWIGIGLDIKPEYEIYEQLIKICKNLNQQFGSTYSEPLHINLYDLDVPHVNLEQIDMVVQGANGKTLDTRHYLFSELN